jgi:mannose-6-phosphate isomerase-like protein (cupin superfamily)
MIKRIEYGGELIALVVPADHVPVGVEFYTPNEFSQQLASMRRPAGHRIPAHVHHEVPREVRFTREVLFIRRGRARLDLYTQSRQFIESLELVAGDVILLAAGGHGMTMIEDTEIVEVKQGPYAGTEDKERFE